MPDEIDTPATVEQAPPPELAPPAPTIEPEQVEQPEADATPAQETWDAIKQRVEQDEALKPDYDQHIKETHGTAWKEAMDSFQPMVTQVQEQTKRNQELYATATEGFQTLSGRLRKLTEDGLLDEEKLTEVLKSHPPAWAALQEMSEQRNKGAYTQGNLEGSWAGLEYLAAGVAQELVNPDLASKYKGRVQDGKQGRDSPDAIAKGFAKDLKTAIEAPIQRKLDTAKAEIDRLVAVVRKGGGPDTTSKGTGGTKSFKEMTPEEQAQQTPEQRDADTRAFLERRKG